MTALNALLAHIERLEKHLNLDRTAGNWVRAAGGQLIWDPWDMDAPPESDPVPRILGQIATIRERLQAEPGYKPPTPEQLEDGRRTFDEAIARIRAERQAIRDFTAYVEAELAAGRSRAEIGNMPAGWKAAAGRHLRRPAPAFQHVLEKRMGGPLDGRGAGAGAGVSAKSPRLRHSESNI
jgi:hypothetical protein